MAEPPAVENDTPFALENDKVENATDPLAALAATDFGKILGLAQQRYGQRGADTVTAWPSRRDV